MGFAILVYMIHPSSRTGEEKEEEEEEGRGTNGNKWKKKSSWVGSDELSFVSVLMKLEDGITISSQYVPLIDWLIGVCCSDPSRGQDLGREVCLLLENVYQISSLIYTWHLVFGQSFL